jgi:hypothetical protein
MDCYRPKAANGCCGQCSSHCDVLWCHNYVRQVPTFQGNLMSSTSAFYSEKQLSSSTTLLHIYHTIWHHMPEDNNLNIHCHEHLKSHISLRLRPLKKAGAIFIKTEILMWKKRWQQKQKSHRRHKMTVISLLQKVRHNLTMTDTKKKITKLLYEL